MTPRGISSGLQPSAAKPACSPVSYTHLDVYKRQAMQTGGVGEHIAAEAARRFAGVRVTACGVPDRFVPQGTVAGLLYSLGLDAAGMAERVERG